MKPACLIASLVFLLSACAETQEVVVMHNPKNDQVAQCRHDPWGSIRFLDVAECVKGYEALGWQRVNPPENK